jgi:hypothetical protein
MRLDPRDATLPYASVVTTRHSGKSCAAAVPVIAGLIRRHFGKTA